MKRGDIDRPEGPVGILKGQEAVKLPPTGEDDPRDIVGNLRVMKTMFGLRLVLGGSHSCHTHVPDR